LAKRRATEAPVPGPTPATTAKGWAVMMEKDEERWLVRYEMVS
jgi:hypothetical protein